MNVPHTAAQSEPDTPDQLLLQAFAHHQAGRLPEAERLYRAVLKNHPQHAVANHNLGLLAVQMGLLAAGLHHLKSAVEASPEQGQYWLSYVKVLVQSGQVDAARQALEQSRQHALPEAEIAALEAAISAKGHGSVAPRHAKKNAPGQQIKKGGTGKPPAPDELNRVIALFNAGRHAECEAAARSLAQRYPAHEFGWKALSTLLARTAPYGSAASIIWTN